MVQKKILIILILIILLPALFYIAYEINSLSENERLVDEIYQQQMTTLLYSVNQYSWDICRMWVDKINLNLDQAEPLIEQELKRLIDNYNAVETIFMMDTTLSRVQLFLATDVSPVGYHQTDVLSFVKQQEQSIKRLIYRKQIGYTQIESFIFHSTEQKILLLFIANRQQGAHWIMGMVLNTEKFIENMLVPRLNEVTRSEFIAGIFHKNDPAPLYATATLNADQINISRNIWLFPDHYLGIRLQGTTIRELSTGRFNRSMVFIVVLVILLIIGAWLLYRNIYRAMELARLKSDFVSNVSHQLRTPLALIRLFGETLEMNRVRSEEEKQQYYQIIGQETERLTHLINNILDFSKMEAGKKQYFFLRKDLNEIVQHTLSFYKFHLENNNFELNTEIASTSLFIQADQEAIEEAVINLLDNAVKYSTDRKYVAVRTGVANKMAYIEVEDYGIGIPDKEQQRIFEKFYRVSSGLTQETKGSGLGLSLVKYIVEAHQGLINVNSEPGKGSRFRLLIPLKEEEII